VAPGDVSVLVAAGEALVDDGVRALAVEDEAPARVAADDGLAFAGAAGDRRVLGV
jgi:hypothetical protein